MSVGNNRWDAQRVRLSLNGGAYCLEGSNRDVPVHDRRSSVPVTNNIFLLADRYVDQLAALQPMLATQMGVPGFDGQWGVQDPSGWQDIGALFKRTLSAIEARYGVPREIVLAVWGMESNFGANRGKMQIIPSLATLAYDGRRGEMFQKQLIASLKILQAGDVDPENMLGSWAGAMGHTQFMPSTFIAYAEDFDGDGKKDVWESEADALASTANYLANSGYTLNQPWGIEVLARTGFDFGLADGNERRIETWATEGLVPARGGTFETGGANYAELWLPAGAEGPKYLLFNNFKAFKTYNNADSYAFAVGLSGDAMGGQNGPIASWPTHLSPLTVSEIKILQAALNAQGFDAGGVDGIPGRKTKGALQAFQKSRGLVADGYPTKQALALVTGEANVGVASSPSGTN